MNNKDINKLKDLLRADPWQYDFNNNEINENILYHYCNIQLKNWIKNPIKNLELIDKTIDQIFKNICWYEITIENSTKWIELSKYLYDSIEEKIDLISCYEINLQNEREIDCLQEIQLIIEEIERSAPTTGKQQ